MDVNPGNAVIYHMDRHTVVLTTVQFDIHKEVYNSAKFMFFFVNSILIYLLGYLQNFELVTVPRNLSGFQILAQRLILN